MIDRRILLTLICSMLMLGTANAADVVDVSFFEKKIRPVLAEHCYRCHSQKALEEKKLRGELQLDTREGTLRGGESGPAVVPGVVKKSLLVAALRHEDFEMPPGKKLPDEIIADFVRWVENGAPDPRDGKAAAIKKSIDYDEGRKHWAFQPVKSTTPRTVKDDRWASSDLDRFILAKIEAKGLKPAADAPLHVLVRRLHFGLTGLPPTPEQLAVFQTAAARDPEAAITQLVDQLLAAPEFGVHWARHWLDGVRFNDYVPSTERYRNWVIDALNKDIPYDQFILRQFAGDQLPHTSPQERDDNLIATQLFAFNIKEMDPVEGMIEVVGQHFLGITINCAKCHDHKYDPFSQADYYGVAGILNSSKVDGAKGLAAEGVALLAEKGVKVAALQDFKVGDTNLLLKGDPKQKGPLVPRQLPIVFAGEQQTPIGSRTSASGRLELAQWIASRDNPLTARVMVNRIWQHLIGKPLVGTPNDFGTQGDAPSHPELLDYLSTRFMDSGWSIKSLIRDIVLSHTFRQASETSPAHRDADMENALFTRMVPRRLHYEEIVDSLYAVAGKLVLERPAVAKKGRKYAPGGDELASYRAAYGVTNVVAPGMFDAPDPDEIVARRDASVSGPQMLFFLNNRNVATLAALAARRAELLADSNANEARATALYRLLFARVQTARELAIGDRYLQSNPLSRFCHALLCTNEFIYLE